MKRNSVIGLIIIALCIGVIVSIYADSSTYSTFSEAKEVQSELVVIAQLNKQKALVYNPHANANYFAFYAIDKKGTECKVVFNNTKPQDFERSEEITMTGKMVDNTFYASKILMKCPSKYNKTQVEARAVSSPTAKI